MPTHRKMSAWLVAGLIVSVIGLLPVQAQVELPAPVDLNSGWQLQDNAKVTDAGAAISTKAFQPHGWLSATVPGTVLTSMVNDGVYTEPLYGENIVPTESPRA